MKTIAIIAVVLAVIAVGIGAGVILKDGTLNLLTPNALLRLADTCLLAAIVLLLLSCGEKK